MKKILAIIGALALTQMLTGCAGYVETYPVNGPVYPVYPPVNGPVFPVYPPVNPAPPVFIPPVPYPPVFIHGRDRDGHDGWQNRDWDRNNWGHDDRDHDGWNNNHR